MANHVRQQIREAAAAVLTGLTTSGARVFQSRLTVLAENELPCLIVETNDEQVQTLEVNENPTLQRELRLTVRALARSNANLDDTLDTMAAEIETALSNSFIANRLSGIVHMLALASISSQRNAEGEVEAGEMTLDFNVTYFTRANAPETAN